METKAVLGLLLIGMLFLFGCSEKKVEKPSLEISVPLPEQNPFTEDPVIYSFNVTKLYYTGSGLRFDLILKDPKTDNVTAAKGKINLIIYGDSGNIVYQNNFTMARSDFIEGASLSMGIPIIFYTKSIPFEDIKSSERSGRAELKITLDNGKILTAKQDYVNLPLTIANGTEAPDDPNEPKHWVVIN